MKDQLVCHIPSDRSIDMSFIHELESIAFIKSNSTICRNVFASLYDKGFLQQTRRRQSKLRVVYFPSNCRPIVEFYERLQPIQRALESPASHFIPQSGAALARSVVKRLRCKSVTMQTYTGEQLRRRGFGGIYAIGHSSMATPCLTILHYKAPRVKKRWALIGKGVTFDMGGHNIKVNEDGTMKMDKLGALTALIVFSELVQSRASMELWCIMPFVENRIGPKAVLPGSVVTLYGGETLNINNTDAEGRILLADCLGWARKHCPADTTLITLATLTHYSEMMTQSKGALIYGNDPEIDQLTQMATKMGEYSWKMPVWPMYQEMTRSDLANYQVTRDRPHNMGSMYAAAFLSNFVHDYKWIHMDISMPDKPYDFVMVRPLAGSCRRVPPPPDGQGSLNRKSKMSYEHD
jgi:leucyl aminopeptidase